MRALMGPRTRGLLEARPPERWERFLEADGEAAGLLGRLSTIADEAPVPEDYRTPLHEMQELGEINDRLGKHDLGSIFEDAEERERVRRMTWTLMHDPEARRLLSELTRRRDDFAAEGGGRVSCEPLCRYQSRRRAVRRTSYAWLRVVHQPRPGQG
jgi:hypothetical protein